MVLVVEVALEILHPLKHLLVLLVSATNLVLGVSGLTQVLAGTPGVALVGVVALEVTTPLVGLVTTQAGLVGATRAVLAVAATKWVGLVGGNKTGGFGGGFGGGNTNNGGFGGGQRNNAFGATNNGGGMFGSNSTAGGFGNTNTTGGFGNTSGGFGGGQTNTGFGSTGGNMFGAKPNAAGFGGAQGSNGFGGTNNATGGFGGATTLGGGMGGMQGGSQQQLMHTGQFPYQARVRSSKGRDADVNIKHAAISIEVSGRAAMGDYYTMNIRNVKQAVGNIAGAVGATNPMGATNAFGGGNALGASTGGGLFGAKTTTGFGGQAVVTHLVRLQPTQRTMLLAAPLAQTPLAPQTTQLEVGCSGVRSLRWVVLVAHSEAVPEAIQVEAFLAQRHQQDLAAQQVATPLGQAQTQVLLAGACSAQPRTQAQGVGCLAPNQPRVVAVGSSAVHLRAI